MDPATLTDEFIKLWGTCGHTWTTMTYRGVPCLQNPCDVWSIQEIIHETRPNVIIETGFAKGGSAMLWTDFLAMINLDSVVVSVDNNPDPHPLFLEWQADLHTEQCELVVADSGTRDARLRAVAHVREMADLWGDRRGWKTFNFMVILDSCHEKDHVLRELDVWASLVSPGCYLLVQDTLAGRLTHFEVGPGPGAAVDEWLPKHPEFAVDRRRERLLLTGHRGGYLKRAGEWREGGVGLDDD